LLPVIVPLEFMKWPGLVTRKTSRTASTKR
jgi:hypothetical protein